MSADGHLQSYIISYSLSLFNFKINSEKAILILHNIYITRVEFVKKQKTYNNPVPSSKACDLREREGFTVNFFRKFYYHRIIKNDTLSHFQL